MSSVKIGIITCSNATQELDCCSVSCLRDFNKRLGAFQMYPEDKLLRLVGIISCSGCPTIAYPEKILKKVDALASFGVSSIHFTYCMMALCPFRKKYAEIIKKHYPEINLVEGTHEAHITYKEFQDKVRCAFAENKSMSDIILKKI